jgi:hypothetical protein
MAAVAAILLANIIVPVVWGDLYPFTSAPMFREAPVRCCQYRVLGADGQQLPAEDWLLHRVYDGNPIGYGVGLRPPEVLEQEYGVVHDEAAIRRHVERQFGQPQNQAEHEVEVEQTVLGAVGQSVGIVESNRWLVPSQTARRPGPR